MILQRQPNSWSCAPTAWAMAFNCPVEEVIRELGHDGSRVQWPDEPEPKRRRGFHSQEFVRLALKHNYSVMPIELFPVLNDLTLEWGDNFEYFKNIIRSSFGVIEGQGHRCKHAVAYDHGLVYDPAGRVYPYSKKECEAQDFYTQCAWRFHEV